MLNVAAAIAAAAALSCAAGDDAQRGASTAAPVARELPAIVARVNDEKVERWEVEAAVREITIANLHPLPQAERDELVRTVLDRIIDHHLAAQLARARGIGATEIVADVQTKEIAAAMKHIGMK